MHRKGIEIVKIQKNINIKVLKYVIVSIGTKFINF